jgi:23S rRNA G2445 N2-methylase RlmL
LKRADATKLAAPAPEGVIVTNPPYGVRLGADDDLRQLYAGFADNLKRNFAGWDAWLLCGEQSLVKAIRLSPRAGFRSTTARSNADWSSIGWWRDRTGSRRRMRRDWR